MQHLVLITPDFETPLQHFTVEFAIWRLDLRMLPNVFHGQFQVVMLPNRPMRFTRTKNKDKIRRIAKVVLTSVFKAVDQEFSTRFQAWNSP